MSAWRRALCWALSHRFGDAPYEVRQMGHNGLAWMSSTCNRCHRRYRCLIGLDPSTGGTYGMGPLEEVRT